MIRILRMYLSFDSLLNLVALDQTNDSVDTDTDCILNGQWHRVFGDDCQFITFLYSFFNDGIVCVLFNRRLRDTVISTTPTTAITDN